MFNKLFYLFPILLLLASCSNDEVDVTQLKANGGAKYGGEFHRVSLWRGRLWPLPQDNGETGLSEAGSKQWI